MSIKAYANPQNVLDEQQRADGYGLVRFRRADRSIRMECWPRFSRVEDGDAAQFPGWPVTITMQQNDGRRIVGRLPELQISNAETAVVQVISEADGDILYTVRTLGPTFSPPVYTEGTFTLRIGHDRPDAATYRGLTAGKAAQPLKVTLPAK
jgi:hypothetical protein